MHYRSVSLSAQFPFSSFGMGVFAVILAIASITPADAQQVSNPPSSSRSCHPAKHDT
jgi:hypothetical protein